MAYYINGQLIGGANTFPKMTMTQYLALPADQRPTYWECTDRDYDDISAEDVTYGSGTVKDALDEVHTWTKFGTTTSTTASALSIPADASEVLIVLKTSAVLATAVIPKEEFNNSWSIKNPADTSKEVYYSGSQWRVTASGYTADAYYR